MTLDRWNGLLIWIILDIGYTYPPTSPEENMGRESICFIMFYLIQTFEGRDIETEKEKNISDSDHFIKIIGPKKCMVSDFQIHVLNDRGHFNFGGTYHDPSPRNSMVKSLRVLDGEIPTLDSEKSLILHFE